MTLTLAVRHLAGQTGPVFVAGTLWVDAAAARLFDSGDSRLSVSVADPEAAAAVRRALDGADCLGDALLHAWVRRGPTGAELHTVYHIHLFTDGPDGRTTWGPDVSVRPVPPEYDVGR